MRRESRIAVVADDLFETLTVSDAIWIAWENQIRNESLSTRLGADLYVLLTEKTRLARYAICCYRSLRIIWKRRPKVVFAPNPSLVLAYLVLILRSVFRYHLVIDAHYAGVIAPSRYPFLQRVLDLCNQQADLVIVTNAVHSEHVKSVGGRALICEDPLPDIGRYGRAVSERSKDVFVICSFDVDEPYTNILEAAALLQPDGFVFWVSGNFKKARIKESDWPHVRFTGYVSDAEFYHRLAGAQVVVDLTEQENCLVCGAYEAMMLERPLVTSKTFALQKYFTGGTVFVHHQPQAIAEGIKLAYEKRAELREQIKDWKKQTVIDNAKKVKAIRALLNLNEPERVQD